jgi:hypothetical protein
MGSPKELTRAEIVRAADNFHWTRKGAKWTVIVGERELPARPLVLEAAGVPPNDPTNSHQAVEILRRLGFETRYAKERGDMGPESEKDWLGLTAGGWAGLVNAEELKREIYDGRLISTRTEPRL